MLKKASKRPSLIDEYIPQLVTHYKSACKSVYGSSPYVHEKVYTRFAVFEDDLRDCGISTKDYAIFAVNLLRNRVIKKGWKYPPLNMFLSSYALDRYKKAQATKTVKPINTNNEALLYNELLVARMYIERNIGSAGYVRFEDAVNDLEALLSSEWLAMFDNEGRRPIDEALDVLSREYHVRLPMNYQELLELVKQ